MSAPGGGVFRSTLELYEMWSGGVLGAREVLGKAFVRHLEDSRDALEASGENSPFRSLARASDLARSGWFAWSWAALTAGDRLGRASGLPAPPPSPRSLALATVALELHLGYATLRQRERWSPALVDAGDWELLHQRGAGRALDAAQSLGGVLIKAAQFASTRPDLLPEPYVRLLSALQDRAEPRPWGVIGDAVARELGMPPAEVFVELDEEPVAAASIAQVHRARLHDGRETALKAQYPGIETLVEEDLSTLEAIFETVASFEPGLRLKPITDYLRWTLPLELDFERESRAMWSLKRALSHREDVVVPRPVEELTTSRLLVMEYVEGVKITDRDALAHAGISPRAVAELLNDVFAESLFQRGVLHADPHPGNLSVQPGPRLVLLDHGLTLDLDPDFVGALAKMVAALREWDLGALADSLREAGMPIGDDADLDTLLGLIGVLLGGEQSEAGLGELGHSLGQSVGDIPPKLLLVGRAIGLLDGITRQLDPELDALEIVSRRL